MRVFIFTVFLASVLLFGGCEYETALTEEHALAIDPAVTGHWEHFRVQGGQTVVGDRMTILKYSETEYMVHYPAVENGFYFRAYPMEIGGISCVQLQVIGTPYGPPDPEETTLFHVVSYRLTDGNLEIWTLNPEIVDYSIRDPEKLRAAFLEQKDHPVLFDDPGVFRRVQR